MALITKAERPVFDTDEIKRGDFIRLQQTEDSPVRNGLVARITPEELIVFFMAETANVTNYITIKAEEAEGWYSIMWSHDLNTVNRGGID